MHPRELLAVLVAPDKDSVSVTFDLGDPFLTGPAEWGTYVLSVQTPDGQNRQHLGVRLSKSETKAFVFDFDSATQANYDASRITITASSISVDFNDTTLDHREPRLLTGFSTIEGNDAVTDAPVQLLD
ncbi:hypothetical protein ACFPRL_34710 [Pseudoclavibacter helvolus]|uniref:hypothetical protein n=1 Tax=Pseudoclavibacter helvolus TaxID=255205 RepID=UPI0035EBFFA7